MLRQRTLIGFLSVLICSALAVLAGDEASESLRTDRPVVKVLAPPGVAYFLQSSEDQKVVVVIEVTDATRQGVKTDDAGVPEFDAPDANVEAFARNITYKTEYVDKMGHPVTQFTAVIPMKDLKMAESGGISPPIDVLKMPPKADKGGYVIPVEAMSPVAKFRFVVEDRAGMRSDARSERCVLFIGFPREVYTLPPAPNGEQLKDPKAGAPGKPPGAAPDKKPPLNK
jgi:hypothetical protein